MRAGKDTVRVFVFSNLVLLLSTWPFCTSSLSLMSSSAPWTVKQAVHDYTLKRTVTIRDGAAFLPVQIYRGARVEPAERRGRTVLSNDADAKRLAEDPSLSHSARYVLSKYDQLSKEERFQLNNKLAAEARASHVLDPAEHLHLLYYDDHLAVCNKPSGILSVPGPRRNPSLAGLVQDVMNPAIELDKMVVHRLDMDTSGVTVYALTERALKKLHADFRARSVKKTYTALLAGHFTAAEEVEIDVSLERDPHNPPFMRVTQPRTKNETTSTDNVHPSFQKFTNQAPKPSLTEMQVLSLEYLHKHVPVTRVSLTPHTGRTHQLRVHCAAIGHPIVGDDIYGFAGAGNVGLDEDFLDAAAAPNRREINQLLSEQHHSLCLHAERLCLYHPVTEAPLVFECKAPF
jgi:23S rRNA-/tRNA-specific pseudouridylate synthase